MDLSLNNQRKIGKTLVVTEGSSLDEHIIRTCHSICSEAELVEQAQGCCVGGYHQKERDAWLYHPKRTETLSSQIKKRQGASYSFAAKPSQTTYHEFPGAGVRFAS